MTNSVHDHSDEVTISRQYIGAELTDPTIVLTWQVEMVDGDDDEDDERSEQFDTVAKALARASDLLYNGKTCPLCEGDQ